MKHKLINNNTEEETLCDKITIDGYDYYVSDEHPSTFNWRDFTICRGELAQVVSCCDFCQKVIATNNPKIDVPKVVDDALMLTNQIYQPEMSSISEFAKDLAIPKRKAFVKGYNKSQETHPFSEEDMIEFAEWINKNKFLQHADKLWSSSLIEYSGCLYTTKELLQLWKEQQPKTVYYE